MPGYFAQTLHYSDEDAAALYDLLNPWGASDEFYLALVMKADSVLDVGCGTGTLLRRARCGTCRTAVRRRSRPRDARHRATPRRHRVGRGDRGVDDFRERLRPRRHDRPRLSVRSRRRRTARLAGSDPSALVAGGRFAFETRNPLAREWENWNPANAIKIVDPAGRQLRVSYEVESVIGDLVTVTETTSDQHGVPMRVDRATVRFLDLDTLARLLATAGFQIEAQYGSWSREPLDVASAEIITVARVPLK